MWDQTPATKGELRDLEGRVSAGFRHLNSTVRFLLVCLFAAVAVMVGGVVWLASQIPT